MEFSDIVAGGFYKVNRSRPCSSGLEKGDVVQVKERASDCSDVDVVDKNGIRWCVLPSQLDSYLVDSIPDYTLFKVVKDIDTVEATLFEGDVIIRDVGGLDDDRSIGFTTIITTEEVEEDKKNYLTPWNLESLEPVTSKEETPSHNSPFPPGANRKEYPIQTGLLDYFPRACAAVSNCSYVANEQHNPGEPMHWAKEKSSDHADCLQRHGLERGTIDSDGIRHSTKRAWRALADLEEELEKAW